MVPAALVEQAVVAMAEPKARLFKPLAAQLTPAAVVVEREREEAALLAQAVQVS